MRAAISVRKATPKIEVKKQNVPPTGPDLFWVSSFGRTGDGAAHDAKEMGRWLRELGSEGNDSSGVPRANVPTGGWIFAIITSDGRNGDGG